MSASEADVAELAAALAAELRPGDVVLVQGEVGAGKTTFVRHAARALGVTEPVTSPTFTLSRRYETGRVPVSHLDLHRLGGVDAEDEALLAEELTEDRVAFVEWPEVAGDLPRVVARVRMEHDGRDRRRVTVQR